MAVGARDGVTDRNAIVGTILTAAGILSATVLMALAIGCDHLDRRFGDLRETMHSEHETMRSEHETMRNDIREIHRVDHLTGHGENAADD